MSFRPAFCKLLAVSILIVLIAGMMAGCKKKPTEFPFYYEYYPVKEGRWVTYDVSEIIYAGNVKDTLNYILREVIKEKFFDDQGRETYRIERFWKFNENDPWEIKDVWALNLLRGKLEKVEENLRFDKLVFPVAENKYWDGNISNYLPEWEYTYNDIHQSYNINGLGFDSTVTVFQREELNAIKYEFAYEIYAVNIGMVHKYYKNLEIEGFDVENIKSGIFIEMKYRNHGE